MFTAVRSASHSICSHAHEQSRLDRDNGNGVIKRVLLFDDLD